MPIECYRSHCPYHSYHTNPEDGPFCDEDNCRWTSGAPVLVEIGDALLKGHLCGSEQPTGPARPRHGSYLVSIEGGDGYFVPSELIHLIKES